MRVKMKTAMAGPNVVAHAGHEVDVEDDHGKALIDGGFAEPVAPAAVSSGPAELPLGDKSEPPARSGRRKSGGAPEQAVKGPSETETI